MVKLQILDKTAKKTGEVDCKVSVVIREDIFKKAVLAEQSLFYQEQGSDKEAGKKAAINLSKRRQTYRSTYGRSASRTPKKVMWRRGKQLRYVGAFAPSTVGGRRAHPPKVEKNTIKDVNNKEWFRALKIGFVASLNKTLIEKNGQRVPSTYPFILDDNVETLQKTKDTKEFLEKIGFSEEFERTKNRKIRAGIGKMRSRKYKTKRGILLVISSTQVPFFKSASNIRGVDILTPELLMTSDFGMNEKAGRMVVFTKGAFTQFMEVLNS